MYSLTRVALLSAVVCCGLSTVAHADDVYIGNSSVQNGGRTPEACAPHPVKLTVADGRFSYGDGGAPLAVGALAPDGAFNASYSRSAGPSGRVMIQANITGHVQGGKVVGSLSTTSGCLQNFTLTKQ